MAKKILLADDSMTIQKVVELTFMDQDYEVVAVSDGSAAIAKLDEVRPDIVIADVHMPGADGYAVCRHAKGVSPGTPVLLLVGTFEQFDEQQAAQAGADGHLKKPFDSQELLQKVEAMVAAGGAAPVATPPPSQLDLSTQLATPPPVAPAAARPAPPPVVPEVATPEPAVPEVSEPEPAAEPVVPEVSAPEPAIPEVSAPEPEFRPSTAETRPRRAEQPDAGPALGNGSLSDADVDRIARKVLELAGDKVLKEVAWEVLPDLAEVVVRERIRELESEVE